MHFLFVGGIQRSGTTALANTLNWHPNISVCIERYKYIINKNRVDLLQPSLFELNSLLDFSENYTNNTPQHSERFGDFYKNLENKYGQLRYIGDKIANDPFQLRRIYTAFPRCKIVFIVRDIFEIASSWQTRAEREHDAWPENKTAEQSVAPWNQFNDFVLSLYESYPQDIFVVEYSQFFSDSAETDSCLDRMLDFLQLPKTDEIVEGHRRACEYLFGK